MMKRKTDSPRRKKSVLKFLLLVVIASGGLYLYSEQVKRNTAHKAAILKSELIQMVVTDNKHAIIAVDTDMKVIWYAGDKTFFGYTENEVIGKPINMFVPEAMGNEHTAVFRKRMKLMEGYTKPFHRTIFCTGYRKDGKRIPIVNHLTVIPKNDRHDTIAVAWFGTQDEEKRYEVFRNQFKEKQQAVP